MPGYTGWYCEDHIVLIAAGCSCNVSRLLVQLVSKLRICQYLSLAGCQWQQSWQLQLFMNRPLTPNAFALRSIVHKHCQLRQVLQVLKLKPVATVLVA
jgi:hypothetical protein